MNDRVPGPPADWTKPGSTPPPPPPPRGDAGSATDKVGNPAPQL